MGDVTKIQWTDYTFNPWIGCTKVHTGCKNCYAEADMDTRRGRVKWGAAGTRSRTSDDYWKRPSRWSRIASVMGERNRVFCASLADVFEEWAAPIFNIHGQYGIKQGSPQQYAWQNAPIGGLGYPANTVTMSDLRADLFRLIDSTPWLDWLLLTKRPENIRKMWGMLSGVAPIFPGMPGPLGKPIACLIANAHRPNVWLGTSVSDQATANKAIPELLKCRDLSPVLFLSVEPLLGPIDLQRALPSPDGFVTQADGSPMHVLDGAAHVDWVIVGGESGPNARPCRPEWIRSIVQQCKDARVPCFVKQMGGNVVTQNDMVEDDFNSLNTGWPDPQVEYDIHGYREEYQGADCRVHLRDKKGGDPAEWPEDLRVREFPKGN